MEDKAVSKQSWKIRVELELDVEPFSAEEMVKSGLDADYAEPDEEPDAAGIGECIADHLDTLEEVPEMFAGSNIFQHVRGAKLLRAEQVPA
jgi:hypothetical protein